MAADIGLVKLEISEAINTFKFAEQNLRELLNGRDGAAMRDLSKRAIRVEAAAKRNASGRPGPNVRTGRLRGSITWRLGEDGQSGYADIGSAVLYAPFVELGTSRNRPYPFLRPALEAARG